MIYYTEPIKRRDNKEGRPRMYSDLEGIAVASGWNGDKTLRYFRSEEKLTELPEGVVEIRESEYLEGIAAYEAAKPVPPEPTQRELDAVRLQELRQKKRDGITFTREELDEVTLLKL